MNLFLLANRNINRTRQRAWVTIGAMGLAGFIMQLQGVAAAADPVAAYFVLVAVQTVIARAAIGHRPGFALPAGRAADANIAVIIIG